MATVIHLLNRSFVPARVSCGRRVSRSGQYTDEATRASCVDCSDAHPSLTWEERNEILENANDRHNAQVRAGFAPQAKRERKWPAPWEPCDCGKTESRSWDGWFKAGNKAWLFKTNDTIHAPKRHGGCGPNPETIQAAAEKAARREAKAAAKAERLAKRAARA